MGDMVRTLSTETTDRIRADVGDETMARLDFYKLRYALESRGFKGAEVPRLIFARWLVKRNRGTQLAYRVMEPRERRLEGTE